MGHLKNNKAIPAQIIVVSHDVFLIQLLKTDLGNKLGIAVDYTQELSDIYPPRPHKPVIVLDLDGFDQRVMDDFLANFRHASPDHPLLTLSAATGREAEYRQGGIKWLQKPLRLQQLVEHLQLLLQNNEWKPMETDLYLFDPLHQYIFCKKNNKKVYLTEKEIAILKALHHRPEGLNRKDLLKEIWGYANDIETRTVESHIYRLRQKLQGGFPLHVTMDRTSRKYKLIYDAS